MIWTLCSILWLRDYVSALEVAEDAQRLRKLGLQAERMDFAKRSNSTS
jgi:hypothetical protein